MVLIFLLKILFCLQIMQILFFRISTSYYLYFKPNYLGERAVIPFSFGNLCASLFPHQLAINITFKKNVTQNIYVL